MFKQGIKTSVNLTKTKLVWKRRDTKNIITRCVQIWPPMSACTYSCCLLSPVLVTSSNTIWDHHHVGPGVTCQYSTEEYHKVECCCENVFTSWDMLRLQTICSALLAEHHCTQAPFIDECTLERHGKTVSFLVILHKTHPESLNECVALPLVCYYTDLQDISR